MLFQYTRIFFFLVLFVCFYGCIHGMWKLLGQGMNVSHGSDPRHCSDNSWFLSRCTTRENSHWGFMKEIFFFFLNWMLSLGLYTSEGGPPCCPCSNQNTAFIQCSLLPCFIFLLSPYHCWPWYTYIYINLAYYLSVSKIVNFLKAEITVCFVHHSILGIYNRAQSRRSTNSYWMKSSMNIKFTINIWG